MDAKGGVGGGGWLHDDGRAPEWGPAVAVEEERESGCVVFRCGERHNKRKRWVWIWREMGVYGYGWACPHSHNFPFSVLLSEFVFVLFGMKRFVSASYLIL